MVRRVLVIGALALLVGGAPAATAAAAERGLMVGHHVFGQPPCGAPTVVRGTFVDPAVMAGSDAAACQILLSRRWAPQMPAAMRCTLVLHEYGHLAGRGHSSDPASVMYPDYLRPDERCVGPLVLSTAPRGAAPSGSAPSSE
jgi:hypothetical protein